MSGARRLFVPVLLLFVVACEGGGVGPVVDEVLPDVAGRGDPVDVLGDRFCDDAAQRVDAEGQCLDSVAAFVGFGGVREVVRADAIRFGQRRITVRVPSDLEPGATYIVVTREGVSSNPVAFEVLN